MNDEAISRQAALASIKNLYPDMPIVDFMSARQKWLEKYAPYFECENVIERLPLISPKTGHWVEENINEWSRKVFCSECGCQPPFEHVRIINSDIYSAGGRGVINKTKFCPNCGAQMRKRG